MDLLFEQSVTVAEEEVDSRNRLKLSALLHYAQEAAGGHCALAGLDWDTMAQKNLFWAVLRHKVVISRLPAAGETITVQTWPMPATRSAYPRAVRALDINGEILFEVVSLWVLMHTQTRAMVLPGKSGVDVPGMVRGDEPAPPSSLMPDAHQNTTLWTVTELDLDKNGHVNNAKYLDWVVSLTEDCPEIHTPKEVTICYLAEVRMGEEITLGYTLSDEGFFTVDGKRPRAENPEKPERVFAAKLTF